MDGIFPWNYIDIVCYPVRWKRNPIVCCGHAATVSFVCGGMVFVDHKGSRSFWKLRRKVFFSEKGPGGSRAFLFGHFDLPGGWNTGGNVSKSNNCEGNIKNFIIS